MSGRNKEKRRKGKRKRRYGKGRRRERKQKKKEAGFEQGGGHRESLNLGLNLEGSRTKSYHRIFLKTRGWHSVTHVCVLSGFSHV